MSTELDNLFERVRKDKGVNRPHFVNNSVENGVHQMDLLFLPHDRGYKYALVVVDLATRKTDARPLKSKTAIEVATALKDIYNKGKVLKTPKTIEVDDGSEFKSEFKDWIERNKINLVVKKAGRHRQQAIVERKNQRIGFDLFRLMIGRELLSGEQNTEWVHDLPKVISEINKNARKVKKIKFGDPVCSGDACELIPEGTKVRVALDYPIDVISRKKLIGRFRTHDIRFDPKIRTVTHQLLKPDLPPMYLVSGIHDASYTKNQLQIVDDNEEELDPKKFFKSDQTTYVAKKIHGKKKTKGKTFYLVQFKGFPNKKDFTYEPESEILKLANGPELIREYEKSVK